MRASRVRQREEANLSLHGVDFHIIDLEAFRPVVGNQAADW